MDINDKRHAAAEAVKRDVGQLNASAVVKKMQAFETRLGEQDKRLSQQDARIAVLEQQLRGYAVLEAAAGRIGSGPTSI